MVYTVTLNPGIDYVVEAGLAGKYDLRPLPFIAEVFATPYGDGMGFACEDEMTGMLTSNIGVAVTEDGLIRMELDCHCPASADMDKKPAGLLFFS